MSGIAVRHSVTWLAPVQNEFCLCLCSILYHNVFPKLSGRYVTHCIYDVRQFLDSLLLISYTLKRQERNVYRYIEEITSLTPAVTRLSEFVEPAKKCATFYSFMLSMTGSLSVVVLTDFETRIFGNQFWN